MPSRTPPLYWRKGCDGPDVQVPVEGEAHGASAASARVRGEPGLELLHGSSKRNTAPVEARFHGIVVEPV